MHSTKHVALIALKHESNTFNHIPTTVVAFENGGKAAGSEAIQRHTGKGSEMGGFLAGAELHGWHYTVPLAAEAPPSGRVSNVAYEQLLSAILEGLAQAAPVDGVLIALHGAMSSYAFDDADGETLRRIRAALGAHIPIVATLDLHANVSDAMASHVNGMTAYMTHPHVDHADTGLRAARILQNIFVRERLPSVFVARPPSISGLDSGSTLDPKGPMAAAHRMAAEMLAEEPGVLAISLQAGYSCSDVYETGPSVAITGFIPLQRMQEMVNRLVLFTWNTRQTRSSTLLSAEDAVQKALRLQGPGPFLIGDLADAPAGGAFGDNTAVLHALLTANARDALVAAIHDPEAVHQAQSVDVGATIRLSLGGKLGHPYSGHPVLRSFTVESLSDGQYVHAGPYAPGRQGTFGPSALLRCDGVKVIVTSNNVGIYDLEQLKIFGVVPADQNIIAAKSMGGFLAAFGPISRGSVMCDSGGICSRDVQTRHYQAVRRPVWPLDLVDAAP
jgi:microcystin degradation protein MlrC